MFNDRLMALYWAINPPKSIQIEDAEVLEIKVKPENNDCVMLIRLKVA